MRGGPNADKLPAAVERIMQAESDLADQITVCMELMTRIGVLIDTVQNGRQHEVLRRRYMTPAVDEETGCDSCRWPKWSVIAERIYGNPYERGVKAAQKLNRIAIDKLTNSS